MRSILERLNIRFETDVPIGRERTWYQVGGNAPFVAHPDNTQQLAALASACHEAGVATYVLGAGANLLVLDEGVDGIVVQLDSEGFKSLRVDGTQVTAGPGVELPKLVLETARLGLGGLDCLAGIPATVGGAVRMNAGGTYGDIGTSVEKVEVMNAAGQVYYRQRDDLVFSYRRSNIVARYILDVTFNLTEEDPAELRKRVKEVFFYKRASQPMAERSAGCAFKNPPPEAVPEGSGEKLPWAGAGKLIDLAGLKGFRIGGAEVSQLHANFIVTHAGCKAADVLAVMMHVQQTVQSRFGIALEREVAVWPEPAA